MTTLLYSTPLVAKNNPPRRWLRWVGLALLGLLIIVGLLVAGLYIVAAQTASDITPAPIEAQTTRFDGRYLLVASDADMVGTAYADGILRQVVGDVDTLSVVELPLTDSNARVVALPASNSVTSWPQIIAVAPDGNMVYVVETAAPIPDDVEQQNTDTFPAGRLVTAIDISAGVDNPQVSTAEVGEGAIHLAVSTDGAYLAVGLEERGRQLAILPTATLDDPATFAYFSIEDSTGESAEEVSAVSWHPSGEFLAVGINSRELQFYRVNQTDAGLNITPHGERLLLGNTITYGQFTQDGRFYLTAEINWETVPAPLGNLVNPPGEMISVAFDESETAAHRVASRVTVGLSPEGFAISPQEDLIVTVNMRRTYLPDALAAVTPGGEMNSLSLLRFDRTTGALEVLGQEYGFEGVLPEDAMFDADGDSLGVVIYNERENPMNPGYIEFWNVLRDGENASLQRTDIRVEVVRGPHAMNLIR